ncbi:tripartite tricarboxylate transporter TctB family protein [Sporosarcina sp. P13]|uniref:tripartite tricarboxylate transporter TctB family protein n=1 Tax=Sporosarcina sp. P13 TaxID=2048263 RepID=UPI0013040385|nr:tripartite tricarboxylate transporter TctB family protein [Sporosarcina sp. P13]
MKKEISDISTGTVLLIFSLIGYFYSTKLAVDSTIKYGPDFFPKLVFSLLAFTSVILLLTAILRFKRSKEFVSMSQKVIFGVVLFIVVLIGYIGLFFLTGFIISTIIFLLIGQWLFGIRKIPILIATSILLPFVLYFVFTFLFKIPLP